MSRRTCCGLRQKVAEASSASKLAEGLGSAAYTASGRLSPVRLFDFCVSLSSAENRYKCVTGLEILAALGLPCTFQNPAESCPRVRPDPARSCPSRR